MDFKAIQRMVREEYIRNGYEQMWNSVSPKHAGDIAELGLITSEVAEAMECVRNANYKALKEELADIVIRVMNISSRLNVDLEENILSKNVKNLERTKLHGRKGM